MASIMGEKDFFQWIREEKQPEVKESDWLKKTPFEGLTVEQIAQYSARYYKLSAESLRQLKKGEASGHSRLFWTGVIGLVNYITSKMRQEISDNKVLAKEIERVVEFIINQVT